MQNLLVCLFLIGILISCEESKNYSFENYFQSDKYKLLDLEQKNEKLDSIFESLNVQNRDSITNKRFFKVLEQYSIVRVTPTATAAYLSGQVSDYQDLMNTVSESPLEDDLTDAFLIKHGEDSVEIIHIFINDSKGSERKSN